MTAQLYSVPGQTERRRKDFLEWKGLDLSSKLSLTCVGNVIIKVFIILFLLVGIANILEIFKIVSKLSFQLSFQVYSLLSQTEEERKAFFRGRKKGDHIMRLRQEHFVVIGNEKVSPYVKFEIILPLLCFLLDPLTNKLCSTWSSMINLWINPRTCQKIRILQSARQRSKNYLELSKENVLGNMMLSHWPCLLESSS